MNKYKLTCIGLVLSIFIYVTTIVLELELFEKAIALLESIEQFEFDEMIIPLIVFFVFLFIDTQQNAKKVKMENAKLNIYKAMLSSSHHILNNFIYQMDIFKITAEDTPGFDVKVLAFYEDIISNAAHQINSLSNLTTIDEFSIRTSVMNET
ncbi:hypothetical protein IWQ47_002222 [Aquimarina sp. EL_43]|uniref:hypothetical protein n=1 Tax=Aquimarina TaxID=290174 RepID=UPI00046E60F2|nr:MULTISPECIES: hypothetical protein [Aquimarina]MBG6130758.1 hypothetical protein [Aquimarina sp. EL_35]MBG6151095.1 hypothetical protein [Aquimarina sp. EL_32]MBG6169148.1 hypothetical protein [Aquimarina sp. EL_43]